MFFVILIWCNSLPVLHHHLPFFSVMLSKKSVDCTHSHAIHMYKKKRISGGVSVYNLKPGYSFHGAFPAVATVLILVFLREP